MLHDYAERVTNTEIAYRTDLPHADILNERRRSYLVVDDLITGTYHTTSLESLAMGVPVMAYLDQRVIENLRRISGCMEALPWINFRLNEARGALIEILTNETLRTELGGYSQDWIRRYWNDEILIQYYVQAYIDLVEQPDRFLQSRFDGNSQLDKWFTQQAHDLSWEINILLSRWSEIAQECTGRLVLYDRNGFSHWLLDLLKRQGYAPPQVLACERSSSNNEDWIDISTLEPGEGDRIVLGADTPSEISKMQNQLATQRFSSKVAVLTPQVDQLGYDEDDQHSMTPAWQHHCPTFGKE